MKPVITFFAIILWLASVMAVVGALESVVMADHCRKQVVIQSTGQVIVPFAVPVAVPNVAV